MKPNYPKYYSTGTAYLENKLSSKDKEALDKFCKYCRITAGEKKIRIIRATLLQIYDIIEKPLTKITKEDVQDFLGLVKGAELSEWTKNDIRKFFKKFLKWYYKDLEMIEDIKNTPMNKAFNHEKINESTLVKEEELKKLLHASQTLKWKAILTLMFESACRPQELRLLKWSDIKYTEEGADITFFSPKTKEARTIPIRDCVIHLKRWEQEYCFPDIRKDDVVFPSHKRGVIMSDNALPKQFRILCREAGIRFIHPYLMRHTRLTKMYNDVPEQIVKKYAGHSKSSKMPEIYSHISSKDVREVVLKKIYNIKELTEEQKNKYQKQIDDLKKMLNEDRKILMMIQEDFLKLDEIEKRNPKKFKALKKEIKKLK